MFCLDYNSIFLLGSFCVQFFPSPQMHFLSVLLPRCLLSTSKIKIHPNHIKFFTSTQPCPFQLPQGGLMFSRLRNGTLRFLPDPGHQGWMSYAACLPFRCHLGTGSHLRASHKTVSSSAMEDVWPCFCPQCPTQCIVQREKFNNTEQVTKQRNNYVSVLRVTAP